jgi:hypothetical protein
VAKDCQLQVVRKLKRSGGMLGAPILARSHLLLRGAHGEADEREELLWGRVFTADTRIDDSRKRLAAVCRPRRSLSTGVSMPSQEKQASVYRCEHANDSGAQVDRRARVLTTATHFESAAGQQLV